MLVWGMPRLIVTTHHTTTEFALDRDTFTIGRSPGNDIVIDNPVISRQHARLERTQDGYRITDLGSSNGLQYGPDKITEKILRDGDVIRIADSVSLTYIVPAAETVPVPAGPPSYAGTTAAQAAAPTVLERLGISRRMVTIWGVVLIVGLIVGYLYGFYLMPPDESDSPAVSPLFKTTVQESRYSSTDQRSILDELGSPPSWILLDGPIKPTGEVHRVESWIYPDRDSMYDFVDGKLIEYYTVSLEPASQNKTPKISPSALCRDMTLSEVRSLLDENGEPVEPVDIEGYPDCKAYHFVENGLIISFLDDSLFTAQTYVHMREAE